MEIKIENNDSLETIYLDKVAKAANGSILYKKGKAVILATITTDINADIEGDFLPLTVQYIEKSYANGKFPGGYIKREGTASNICNSLWMTGIQVQASTVRLFGKWNSLLKAARWERLSSRICPGLAGTICRSGCIRTLFFQKTMCGLSLSTTMWIPPYRRNLT